MQSAVIKKFAIVPGSLANVTRSTWEKMRRMNALAFSMFRIGMIGFGGGNALIPVIEAEVVQNRKLVSKEEYDEDVVAASITPGALPVEIAAGIGQRVAGTLGMIFSASMMAAPGVILLVAILTFLSSDSTTAVGIIRHLSIGLSAFIMSLLMLYTAKTIRTEKASHLRGALMAIAIILAVFALVGEKNIYPLLGISMIPFFGLSTLAMLGLAFFLIIYLARGITPVRLATAVALGIAYVLTMGQSELITSQTFHMAVPAIMTILGGHAFIESFRSSSAVNAQSIKNFAFSAGKELSIWAVVTLAAIAPLLWQYPEQIMFVARGYLSSLISFGGGDAYLTIADGLFVQRGALDYATFYGVLVPLVNVLPGSILCKMLTGIGFVIGSSIGGISAGLLAALAGFAISVSGSGMLFGLVARIFRTFHDAPVFVQISRWVRPIIAGLLIHVSLSLFRTSLATGVALGIDISHVLIVTAMVFATSFYLLFIRRMSPAIPMLLGLIGGIALL